MDNILPKLPSNTKNKNCVEVLLATYNGALFIDEFLISLVNQNEVKIHLVVSDDGSKDETLEIIESYKSNFESLRIISGPGNGPAANFFHLLRNSRHDYVALADQDDIWMPNHLIASINRLKEVSHQPGLSISSVCEFKNDLGLSDLVIWPKKPYDGKISRLFLENLGRGCSFVLNRKAVNLLNTYTPQNAIMHDWWIMLLLATCGTVKTNQEPEIYYRLHQNNFVGSKKSKRIRFGRFINNLTSGNWPTLLQLEELHESYFWGMSSHNAHILGSFIRDLRSTLLGGKLHLIFSNKRYRSGLTEEVAFRIAATNFKLRKRGSGSTVVFLYARLRRIFASFTFYLYSIPTRFRNYIDIKIRRKPSQLTLHGEVDVNCKKIAIVALYPRKGIFESATRLVNSLQMNGFQVLAVINNSPESDNWVNHFANQNCKVIHRPNIGRDFGAYKAGYEYLFNTQNLENCEQLIFANDSVYYGVNSGIFISELLSDDSKWLAMFVNFQFHTHAQSFFQRFDKSIFHKKYFAKFWSNYYPTDLRHKTINKGEVQLSQICLMNGNTPEAYVSAERILTNDNFHGFTYDEKFGIWSNHGLLLFNSEIANEENTKFLMRRQYLENNITHHQGLLATRVLAAPLKIDIFQTGQATLEGIHHSLASTGISESEIKETIKIMAAKGTHMSKKGFRRLWSSYGYI